MGKTRYKILTAKEEAFAQAIASGKLQYVAYHEAYPYSKSWKQSVVDSKASGLVRKPHIAKRVKELRQPTLDLLEANREKLIQKAIDSALNNNSTILSKLLDKIYASKTETKSEVSHTFNIVFNNLKENG